MRKIVFAILSLNFLLGACSKEELSNDLNKNAIKELSISSGEYGPEVCDLPDPDDADLTICGAQCALTDHGGCWGPSECRGRRTEGSFTQVYESLLNSGDIQPLSPGDAITHPLLLEAMRNDGHPLN